MNSAVTSPRSHHFDHPALFYRDPHDYLATIVPFIRAGLDADEPVLAAVPWWNLDLLREALGSDADLVDLHDMTSAGRNPGRIIGEVLLAYAGIHKGRRVRIVGEPIWAARTPVEYPACVQHEALINTAFSGRSATILCPYNVSDLDRVVLDDARRTHPVLWYDDICQASGDYADPLDVVRSFNVALPAMPSWADTIDVDPGDPAAVHAFATVHASAAGLSGDRTRDALVVVAELAGNTTSHTSGGGQLSAWTAHDQLVFELGDGGHLTDPLVGRVPAPADQPGGRGLLLVNRLADLVRVHTQPTGTTIRVYFNIQPES